MKKYKLLILLLTFIGIGACTTEYLDNGERTDSKEEPEAPDFKAMLVDNDAEYVGDTFVFEATLNGVDVTSTTTFKVNGKEINRIEGSSKGGNVYKPKVEGKYEVEASLEDYTDSFEFTVIKEEEEEPEPDPTGNRIEYDGKSYPVSETVWVVHSEEGAIQVYNNTDGVACTIWMMVSSEYDSNDNVLHQFVTAAFVPLKSNHLAFPNESSEALEHIDGGAVVINGSKVFDTTDVTYTFDATGNTAPASGTPSPWSGTANYTSVATGADNGDSAELFWNGTWNGVEGDLLAKAKMGNIMNGLDTSRIKNLKSLGKAQIENLEIVK